jgi:hypothetical protein
LRSQQPHPHHHGRRSPTRRYEPDSKTAPVFVSSVAASRDGPQNSTSLMPPLAYCIRYFCMTLPPPCHCSPVARTWCGIPDGHSIRRRRHRRHCRHRRRRPVPSTPPSARSWTRYSPPLFPLGRRHHRCRGRGAHFRHPTFTTPTNGWLLSAALLAFL